MEISSFRNSSIYYDELRDLKVLILKYMWYYEANYYFSFAKKCKTSIARNMSNELANAIIQYDPKKQSEEKVKEKFQETINLIDLLIK